jgi:2-phospho-L-lactate guanylyltransferase
MTEPARFGWTVLLPVKVLAQAKSRLAVLAGERRHELALAVASDTVSAVVACPEVARVIVVTSDPVAGPRLLSHGAAEASRRWPGTGLAALTADLPALRPAELAEALRAAADTGGAAFVPDAAGLGTTMYAVVPGAEFRPMYGGASRARHAAGGATELALDGIAGLRQDVDTPDDLRAAVALGVGPRTAEVAAELLADA